MLRKVTVSILLISFHFIFTYSRDSSTNQFIQINDHRLCNNAESLFNTTRNCRHEEYRKAVPCDDRVVSSDQCQQVSMLISKFTSDALTQLVPTIDSDLSIRRIHIKLTTPMQLIDYDQLGNEIDRFLLMRPWWYVSKEPYAWHGHTHSSNVIIIDRVKHGFEKELRLLGSRQYRTAENCEKAPLTIGTLDAVHPGWLTVLVFYTTAQGNIPFSVFGIYVPHKNAFISQNDCPDNHNKWECGFLKTTNCSLPKIITDCTTHDCIRSIPEVSDTTVLFTSASINATYVRPNTEEHKGLKAMAHYPIPINENLNVLLKELDVYVTPVMKYRKPYLDSVPWTGFLRAGVFPFMKFIFRQTYLYRSHIARLLDRFYSKTGVRNTDRCVAAHVRRGDRATSFGEQITNMTEYCYKHRHNRGE